MRTIREILNALQKGELTLEQAEKLLQAASLAPIGDIVMLDVKREERSGVPEVVYAETKGVENLIEITKTIIGKTGVALLTRVNATKVNALIEAVSDFELIVYGAHDHHTVLAHHTDWSPAYKGGKIAILTAGTSDVPYAREAEAVARVMGVEVLKFYDVGVAGIHRLIEPMQKIIEDDVDSIIVFAGMEGALPTVVASLVDIPVIGVPVPTGYGYMGEGKTALASMLQSCSPGLAVVNIGNGLGAGAIACLIARRCARKTTSSQE
jgi:NCAIR mutase (PurE)-related protein